jgi:hypothetical protein
MLNFISMRQTKNAVVALLLSLVLSTGYAQNSKKTAEGYLYPGIAKDIVTVIAPSPRTGGGPR